MIDWSELFGFSVSPLELVVRGSFMYWLLFLLFRFVVRRDVGAVGIADILLLVLVADAAQNAMAGEYRTVSDGAVLVVTLIGWTLLLDWLALRFRWFNRFAEPRPLPLVRNGRVMRANLRRQFLTEDDLMSKLRQHGCEDLATVKAATLEPDGEVSVIIRGKKNQATSSIQKKPPLR